MTATARPAGPWPEIMRAETAAAYLDEPSVEAFRRRVGTVYPRPRHITGRGQVWFRVDLDETIRAMRGEQLRPAERRLPDAAGLL